MKLPYPDTSGDRTCERGAAPGLVRSSNGLVHASEKRSRAKGKNVVTTDVSRWFEWASQHRIAIANT